MCDSGRQRGMTSRSRVIDRLKKQKRLFIKSNMMGDINMIR